jgi:hypothetical protein
MNEQTVIDRITETENLTDGLEDEDANWLIDWGISHACMLIQNLEDDETANTKLIELMAVMRRINQITADRNDKPGEVLAKDIRLLTEDYVRAFGQVQTMSIEVYQNMAAQLSGKSAREVMQSLINWLSPTAG